MIILENVTQIYKNRKTKKIGLDNVSITLPSSGLVVIYGKPGSGKSTLLNILASIDKPSSGKVIFKNNSDFTGVMLQEYQMIETLTVYENLTAFTSCSLQYLYSLLDKFQLLDKKNKYPKDLSGGELQRVSLIRLIIEDANTLLIDEPTSNLDYDNKNIVLNSLVELSKTKLVVVVTHEVDLFLNSADVSIKLKDGKVVNQKINKEIEDRCVFKETKKKKSNLKAINKSLKNRHLITINLVLYILVFSLFLTSLNVMMHCEVDVYNTFAENSVVNNVDFVKEDKVTKEDINVLYENNISHIKFIDSIIYMNDVSIVSRIYLGKCENDIICGSTNIKNDEAVVSDFVATQYMKMYNLESYIDILGKKIEGFKIVGVYETKISDEVWYDLNILYETMYIVDNEYLDIYDGISLINTNYKDLNKLLDLDYTYNNYDKRVVSNVMFDLNVYSNLLAIITILFVIVLTICIIGDIKNNVKKNSHTIAVLAIYKVNIHTTYLVMIYNTFIQILIASIISSFISLIFINILNAKIEGMYLVKNILDFNFSSFFAFVLLMTIFLTSIYYYNYFKNYKKTLLQLLKIR